MNPVLRKIFVVTIICLLVLFSLWIRFIYNQTEHRKADLLIVNAHLLTLESDNTVIPNGWLAIKGSLILDLGNGSPPKDIQAKEQINAAGKLVMPGLINMHTHLGMTGLLGKIDNAPLPEWLNNLAPLEKAFSEQDVYQASLQGALLSLSNGVTSVNDMYFFPEKVGKATTQAGIRAWVRLPIEKNGNTLIFTPPNNTNPLIRQTLAPNPLDQYSVEQLALIAKFAGENNLPIHIHFESDADEKNAFYKQYGLTPLDLLEATGLSSQRLLLAHGVYLSNQESAKLSTFPNAAIITTPRSELNLFTPITPIPFLKDSGVLVTVGTDGLPSSGSLDVFAELNLLYKHYPTHTSPELLIHMATTQAAKALGVENSLGSLKAGKQADIIIINSPPNITNPYHWLINQDPGNKIEKTFVAGKLKYSN